VVLFQAIFFKKLQGTELVEVGSNGSLPEISLTDRGIRFAEWLVSHGKKAAYLMHPYGTWGSIDGLDNTTRDSLEGRNRPIPPEEETNEDNLSKG
jgi:hypothetical protein